jgi:hypothetical protein
MVYEYHKKVEIQLYIHKELSRILFPLNPKDKRAWIKFESKVVLEI